MLLSAELSDRDATIFPPLTEFLTVVHLQQFLVILIR